VDNDEPFYPPKTVIETVTETPDSIPRNISVNPALKPIYSIPSSTLHQDNSIQKVVKDVFSTVAFPTSSENLNIKGFDDEDDENNDENEKEDLLPDTRYLTKELA
jgi:hypothetical protein